MLLYSSELVFSITKTDSLPRADPVPSGPARSGCAAPNSFSREGKHYAVLENKSNSFRLLNAT